MYWPAWEFWNVLTCGSVSWANSSKSIVPPCRPPNIEVTVAGTTCIQGARMADWSHHPIHFLNRMPLTLEDCRMYGPLPMGLGGSNLASAVPTARTFLPAGELDAAWMLALVGFRKS